MPKAKGTAMAAQPQTCTAAIPAGQMPSRAADMNPRRASRKSECWTGDHVPTGWEPSPCNRVSMPQARRLRAAALQRNRQSLVTKGGTQRAA